MPEACAGAAVEGGWWGQSQQERCAFIFALEKFKVEGSRLLSPLFMVTQLLLILFAAARRCLRVDGQALSTT